MANMRPPDPPQPRSNENPDGPPKSEIEVFEALRDQLSDEYTVFYSLTYLSREKRLNGEVDFLIAHPSDGLLFLECKGYGISVNHKNQWFRRAPSGREMPTKSPIDQVQDQMHDVMALIKDSAHRLSDREGTRTIYAPTYGYGLIFPFSDNAEQLERLDLAPELILDGDEMESLAPAIKRAMTFWNEKHSRSPITTNQYRTLLDRVISPAVNVVPDLNDAMAVERRKFRRLDVQQSFAVQAIVFNRRMAIRGGAGTGKTMIAIEAARQMRDRGDRVLLLCFNKFLSQHLEQQVALLDTDEDRQGDGVVDVSTFHKLCADAAEKVKMEFAPPGADASSEERQAFWNESCAEYIEYAAIDGSLEKYDTLLIDEWQDFHRDWLSPLRSLLKNETQSSIGLLYDTSQSIFDKEFEAPSQLEFPIIPLPFNYRNTRAIVRFLDDTVETASSSHPEAPSGHEPEIHVQHSPKQARKEIAALIKRLTRDDGVSAEQIVILTPHRRNSFIGERGSIEGVPFATDPFDRDGRVLWTTLSSFKGLESDVVILADIDENDPRSGQNEVYVAASRARHRLFVWRREN